MTAATAAALWAALGFLGGLGAAWVALRVITRRTAAQRLSEGERGDPLDLFTNRRRGPGRRSTDR